MLWWLIGVAVFVLIWGVMWQSQPKLAFGVLLGLLLAWFFSRFIRPYVTGMEEVPLWLPPLPFAIVAVTLIVAGVLIWLRADKLAPPKVAEEPAHGGDHGGHGHH
jgi:hypothetical protein